MDYIIRNKMAGFTLEQLKQMGAKPVQKTGGLTVQQLQGMNKPPEPTFVERVKEDVKQRQENLLEGVKAEIKGEQTEFETRLQEMGQAAGLVFDVAGEAMKSVVDKIPDAIKKPLKSEFIDKTLKNPLIQTGIRAISYGIDKYKEWKGGNPRAARNLEGVVNIAMLMPTATIGKPVTKLVSEGMEGAAGVLEKGALAQKSKFVETLVSPIKTKIVKEAEVARTTEVGMGLLKKSVIEPTILEKKAAEAVLEIPKLSPQKTFQQNYNIIQDYNRGEAEKLTNLIKTNDFIISKQEIKSKLTVAAQTLKESPLIIGDAEKTAQKLLIGAEKIIDKNPGKGSGILQARKEFDRWVLNQKPKAFDAAAENAFTTANREIRNAMNDLLESKAPNLKIKESLARQSSLYRAMENIVPKAAEEANSAIGRFLQNMGNVLGTKNRAVQIIAASVGIGGLGAAATFAPAAAVIGGGGLFIYKAGKLLLRPDIKMAMAKSLRLLSLMARNEIASGGTGIILMSQVEELKKLIDTYSINETAKQATNNIGSTYTSPTGKTYNLPY